MSLLGYALKMAKEYYNADTYEHALRVASYVAENLMIPENKLINCIALAIMHDLIEDTEYSKRARNDLYNSTGPVYNEYFFSCLMLLTRTDAESYIDYIKKIKASASKMPEAYWVKLADMKDHFTEKETLTDALKEKYLNALPYLL